MYLPGWPRLFDPPCCWGALNPGVETLPLDWARGERKPAPFTCPLILEQRGDLNELELFFFPVLLSGVSMPALTLNPPILSLSASVSPKLFWVSESLAFWLTSCFSVNGSPTGFLGKLWEISPRLFCDCEELFDSWEREKFWMSSSETFIFRDFFPWSRNSELPSDMEKPECDCDNPSVVVLSLFPEASLGRLLLTFSSDRLDWNCGFNVWLLEECAVGLTGGREEDFSGGMNRARFAGCSWLGAEERLILNKSVVHHHLENTMINMLTLWNSNGFKICINILIVAYSQNNNIRYSLSYNFGQIFGRLSLFNGADFISTWYVDHQICNQQVSLKSLNTTPSPGQC